MRPVPPTPARPRARRVRGALAALAAVAALAGLPAIALQAAPQGGDTIDGARAQVRELEAELVRLDAEAGAAAAAHAAARERAEGLRSRIRETTEALAEARRAQEVAVGRLSDRLVAIYVQEPPSLVEVVLGSGGLSDALDTQAALDAISEGDGRLVGSLERARERLARTRAELVARRAEADEAVDEAAQRLAGMEALLASRRIVLDRAAATLDRLVAQERRREEAAAARRARAVAIDDAGREAEEAVRARARGQADPAPASSSPSASASGGGAGSVPGGPSQAVLERIAQCESGGNPRAVSASGQYRGKYQFDPGTWRGVGGSGDPAAASEAEQDLRAALLYARSGPAPWPVCGYR